MKTAELQKLVLTALDDLKAIDVVVLNVSKLTSITDVMIVCSGRSQRHVQSIAENVVITAKRQGVRPLSVEGQQTGEWILVDLGDVLVHVMLPPIREFYQLEKFWSL